MNLRARGREMYYPRVLFLSIIEIPSLPSRYWHRSDPIWRRTKQSECESEWGLFHTPMLPSYNCCSGVISWRVTWDAGFEEQLKNNLGKADALYIDAVPFSHFTVDHGVTSDLSTHSHNRHWLHMFLYQTERSTLITHVGEQIWEALLYCSPSTSSEKSPVNEHNNSDWILWASSFNPASLG